MQTAKNNMNMIDLEKSQKACEERLKTVGASDSFIKNFLRLHSLIASGTTGIIADDEIEPAKDFPKLSDLEKESPQSALDTAGLSKLVVCKLNGGLGTSMGLRRAKSLLHVRYDDIQQKRLSFNQLNARQISLLGNDNIPFINMVSFNTAKDVQLDLENTELKESQRYFLNQNVNPKILSDSLMPAEHEDDSLCWNPPGHGDFYEVFFSSGMLDRFIEQGKRYLFISNADNLSASPNLTILNHMIKKQVPFLSEVTRRTNADRKGGHLARRKSDNRLILRETAQAPVDQNLSIIGDFQDIERHRCFNINSIWIDLLALKKVLLANDGILPLALIRNQKTLDPRDSKSPAVFQIETAMGAAIECFEGAELLEVGRERFAPVKTTSDLLLILSDCFDLDNKGALFPKISPLPQIELSAEYRMIDAFEELIPVVPSLVASKKFSLSGNIKIAHELKIIGEVSILDLRSDKSEPVDLGRKYQLLENVEISISDSGQNVASLRQ